MTASKLRREELDNYLWWHSNRLADRTVTPGKKTLDLMSKEFQLVFDPVDLRGKSLLDVGAWNGRFSIEAKRRGADRVVAPDYFTWNDLSLRGRAVERNLDEPGKGLNNDGSNWWGSNCAAIEKLLMTFEFSRIDYQDGSSGRRGLFHA